MILYERGIAETMAKVRDDEKEDGVGDWGRTCKGGEEGEPSCEE